MAEQAFRPAALPISGRVTPAAFPFYTTGEDNLRIVSRNAAAGVIVQLTARLLGSDGRPTPMTPRHTPATDRSSTSNDFGLSGLTLLNLQVSVVAGAPIMGQTYVVVQLIRGMGAAAIVLGTIASGYVTVTRAIGWPGSPLESPLDGGGYPRHIVGSAPGAGNGILEAVPTGARWALRTFRATLLTSAVVANRRARFVYFVGGLPYYTVASVVDVPALTQRTFNWAEGTPSVTAVDASHVNVALPRGITAPAGMSLLVSVENMDAADVLAAPQYTVDEWLDD